MIVAGGKALDIISRRFNFGITSYFDVCASRMDCKISDSSTPTIDALTSLLCP